MIAGASEAMERGHQERLAPMAAEVMAEAGLGFAELGKIAVTLGPGSFTGLRVGLAFAKGLHLATDAPLAGVGTLAALAMSAGDGGVRAGVIDARRGLVYLQAFEGETPLTAPEVLALEEAVLRLARGAPGQLRLVGPGAPLLGAVLRHAVVNDLAAPDLAALGRLAERAAPDPDLRPLYLRGIEARPMAPASLRPATRRDGAALAEVHATAFEAPWRDQEILRFAEDRGGYALVAEAERRIVGFILCRAIAGEAEVLTLAVRPEHRRKGIAAALVEAAARVAARASAVMFLEVAADNPGAVALYEKAGFAAAGRRAGYYGRPSGGAVDAIVMRRALNS